MRDLLSTILDAIKIVPNFEMDCLDSALKTIDEGYTVDWDMWSGEQWVSILSGTTRIAIVSTQIPLSFILGKNLDVLKENFFFSKFAIIEIENFSDQIWQIDIIDLTKQIPNLNWHASIEAVNPNKFSTDDFWYATI